MKLTEMRPTALSGGRDGSLGGRRVRAWTPVERSGGGERRGPGLARMRARSWRRIGRRWGWRDDDRGLSGSRAEPARDLDPTGAIGGATWQVQHDPPDRGDDR